MDGPSLAAKVCVGLVVVCVVIRMAMGGILEVDARLLGLVRMGIVLRHGRDVHPTWVKSSIETLSNTKRVPGVLSTRAKSEEDFVSY